MGRRGFKAGHGARFFMKNRNLAGFAWIRRLAMLWLISDSVAESASESAAESAAESASESASEPER